MKIIELATADARAGLVLARDVRKGPGGLPKGKLLSEADAQAIRAGPPGKLHAIELEAGDLHEEPAGRRLAAAAAGEGVEILAPAAGTLPIAAKVRGLVSIDAARLLLLNDVDDLIVATLPDGQVVREGELVARAKVIPFVTSEERVRRAEALVQGGVVAVQPFLPKRVAAVVEDRLEAPALAKFQADFGEKIAFFGGTLLPISPSAGAAEALAESLRAALGAGAHVALVAAGRSMDPKDPALEALSLAGGKLVKHGVPVHPGALLWLGLVGAMAVIGVPSCGIASKATALDVILARLMAGDPPSRDLVAALGAGGMLTETSRFRLPPYRPRGPRGELDAT